MNQLQTNFFFLFLIFIALLHQNIIKNLTKEIEAVEHENMESERGWLKSQTDMVSGCL